MQKNKAELLLPTTGEKEQSRSKGLNVRIKMIKLFFKKKGENLCDLGLSNVSLNITSKV